MHEGAKLPIPSRACCVNPSTQVDLYKAPEPLAKSLHLNQTTQKILAKLSYPKHSGIEHFKRKNILRSSSSLDTWNPESLPPRESRNHLFYYFPLVIILRRSCQRKSNPRRHDIYNAILKYKWVLFLFLFASVKCICNKMSKRLPFTDGHEIITVKWL